MSEQCKPKQSKHLSADAVQVWRVNASAVFHDCWRLLLPEEIERARRIQSNVARDEFVAGRGTLRLLLGRALGCEPRAVRLSVGPNGKPKLAGDEIDFNLAHSHGAILIALSRAGAVGIDIEHEDREVEALDIARGSFHAQEIQWIERATELERAAIFFRCWTRKEAIAKVDGRGLTLPLDAFSVCFPACDSIHAEERISISGYSEDQPGYYVRDLPLDGGVAAALALTRPAVPVTVHEFCGSQCFHRAPAPWPPAAHSTMLQRVTT